MKNEHTHSILRHTFEKLDKMIAEKEKKDQKPHRNCNRHSCPDSPGRDKRKHCSHCAAS